MTKQAIQINDGTWFTVCVSFMLSHDYNIDVNGYSFYTVRYYHYNYVWHFYVVIYTTIKLDVCLQNMQFSFLPRPSLDLTNSLIGPASIYNYNIFI